MITQQEILEIIQDKPAIVAASFTANYFDVIDSIWKYPSFTGNGSDIWINFERCQKFLETVMLSPDDPSYWHENYYNSVIIWFEDGSWINTEYISDEYEGAYQLIYYKCPEIPIF